MKEVEKKLQTFVAMVMERLEYRGVDLEDFGGQTVDEITTELWNWYLNNLYKS